MKKEIRQKNQQNKPIIDNGKKVQLKGRGIEDEKERERERERDKEREERSQV